MAEKRTNMFSNTSEHLFLTFQSVCGKVKWALNQQNINNAQNQIPVVAHFYCRKGTGSWYSVVHLVHHKKIQAPNCVFLFTDHLKKLV